MIRQNIKPPNRLNHFCFLWGLPKHSKPLSYLLTVFLVVYKYTAKRHPKESKKVFPTPGTLCRSFNRQHSWITATWAPLLQTWLTTTLPWHRTREMVQLCAPPSRKATSCLLSSAPFVPLFSWHKGPFSAVAQRRTAWKSLKTYESF